MQMITLFQRVCLCVFKVNNFSNLKCDIDNTTFFKDFFVLTTFIYYIIFHRCPLVFFLNSSVY